MKALLHVSFRFSTDEELAALAKRHLAATLLGEQHAQAARFLSSISDRAVEGAANSGERCSSQVADEEDWLEVAFARVNAAEPDARDEAMAAVHAEIRRRGAENTKPKPVEELFSWADVVDDVAPSDFVESLLPFWTDVLSLKTYPDWSMVARNPALPHDLTPSLPPDNNRVLVLYEQEGTARVGVFEIGWDDAMRPGRHLVVTHQDSLPFSWGILGLGLNAARA